MAVTCTALVAWYTHRPQSTFASIDVDARSLRYTFAWQAEGGIMWLRGHETGATGGDIGPSRGRDVSSGYCRQQDRGVEREKRVLEQANWSLTKWRDSGSYLDLAPEDPG
jgi:hypothetical protein